MQVPLRSSRVEARWSVLAHCAWLLLAGCSLACSRGATAPAPPRTVDVAAPPPSAQTVTRPASTDPITVPREATFRDLVARARDVAPAKRAGTCLVREDETRALVLETLDVEEGDLPDPPDDLDALLDRNVYVASDIAWGTRLVRPFVTDGGNYLDLVALTPVPRLVLRANTMVLVVTDRSVYLGMHRTVGFRHLETLPPKLVTAALAQVAVWIVAAEGAAPLTRVKEALDTLREAKGSVVLATPLPMAAPGSTALTSPHWPVPTEAPERCRPGVYERTTIQFPGDYSDEKHAGVMKAFERAASSCGAKLPAGAGGTLDVRALIRPDGDVEDACIDSDDALDGTLRSCLADAVRHTRFPAPDKRSGWVAFGTRPSVAGPPILGICGSPSVAPTQSTSAPAK
ncbi:hypothetical protein [Polyangium sp. 15x6]|uniref:hypothetical protein n=1 Tax=Polyangium sp. 15x6 TaxID=3042687 RepID=UPI00249A13DB|nr:hypothetical protein [Polyangium sp. 15x6]MDI3283548.1 hypothetical protein [Polyangium sp. 15x6]